MNNWKDSIRKFRIYYYKIIMTELQENIIALRKEGLTYRAIQLKLGNPSKKFIRETLLEYEPKLVGDVVQNFKKL